MMPSQTEFHCRECGHDGEKLEKLIFELRRENAGYIAKINRLVEAAHSAVDYVGMANYASREARAHQMIRDAAYPQRD